MRVQWKQNNESCLFLQVLSACEGEEKPFANVGDFSVYLWAYENLAELHNLQNTE